MDIAFPTVYVVFLLTAAVICGAQNRNVPEDSFDESFELSEPPTGRNVKQKPVEDEFLGFLNRLVNTGYTSSRIALNRIQKASRKRKEFGEQLQEFLVNLPSYREQGMQKEAPSSGVIKDDS